MHRIILVSAVLLGITALPAIAGHGVTPMPLMIALPDLRPSPRQLAARAALRDLSRAQSELSRNVTEQLRWFKTSPEWENAVDRARTTRHAYYRAKRELLKTYHQTPDYRAAQIEIYHLQESLDAARAQPHKNRQRIIELAHELLAKRSAITDAESELMAADEALRDARYAMIDADAEVYSLRENFEAAIRSDPDWRTAKRDLDAAHERLAALGDR